MTSKTPALVSCVPDSLKQKLLWAFNDKGEIDLPMFTTIITHEGYALPPRELCILAHEISEQATALRKNIEITSMN